MRLQTIFGAMGGVLLITGTALAEPLVTGSLTLYYNFDSVGTTVADGSGHGYNGSVNGTVNEVAGIRGKAAEFGTSGLSYIDVNGPGIASADIPTAGVTIAAFIELAGLSDHGEIFNARSAASTFIIHSEIRTTPSFRFVLRDGTGTNIGNFFYGDQAGQTPPVIGQWQHVAMTYDKAAAKMAIYVNGNLGSEFAVSNAADIADNWGMGARVGATVDDARPFNGQMDEFYLFTRPLTGDEIKVLAAVPEPSSLVLLAGAALASLVFWRRRK